MIIPTVTDVTAVNNKHNGMLLHVALSGEVVGGNALNSCRLSWLSSWVSSDSLQANFWIPPRSDKGLFLSNPFQFTI
jgi:hypothetical protein